MPKLILAQIFKTGFLAENFICNGPTQKQYVDAEQKVEGTEWFTPHNNAGIFEGYDKSIQNGNPGGAAVQTVRLRDLKTGDTTWILGSATDWATAVNACCGPTAEMPDVILPANLIEEYPCPIAVPTPGTPTWNFVDVLERDLLAGEKILLSGLENGVALPAASAAGYTNIAAAVTAANTLWGAYGTFTATNDSRGIKWASTTVSHGVLNIDIKPAP